MTSTSDSDPRRIAQTIQELLHRISLDRLRTLTGQESDLEIRLLPIHQKKILGHWLSLIAVSGDALSVLFKVHYMSQDARILDPQKNAPDGGSRFIDEYCNVVAGALKGALAPHQLTLGLSLPLPLRGFEELFLAADDSRDAFKSVWEISHSRAKIICSAVIEILEPSQLSHLNAEILGNLSLHSGTVEIL